MKYTFRQFQADFPDDDACLDRIMLLRYGKQPYCPKCDKETDFHRIQNRRQYACSCGYQLAPCAGTIYEKSRTPLTLWFHSMYLMTATRNGVSAKELERQLGVTYKCAWRIGHQIRSLMAERNEKEDQLSGHVEIDETYVGGKSGTVGNHMKEKTIVMGMMERGGKLKSQVIPNVKRATLRPIITENVQAGTTISTDELRSYKALHYMGYNHDSVKHGYHQYAKWSDRTDALCCTNSIEGYWGHLKKGIGSTHVHVSPKHLQKYVGEFEFRFNNRKNPALMFYRMLAHLSKPH